MTLHCPLCQAAAEKVRRKGSALTARFECPECHLRFSISHDDLDRMVARLAAQYGGALAGAVQERTGIHG